MSRTLRSLVFAALFLGLLPAFSMADTALPLNASAVNTSSTFYKYLYSFPLPAGTTGLTGLSGSASITSAKNSFSEALISVHHMASTTCPQNGEVFSSYTALFTKYPMSGVANYIIKQPSSGTSVMPTQFTLPLPKPMNFGCLVAILDGSILTSGTFTMTSNIVANLASSTPPSPVPTVMGLDDEFCFNQSWGCQIHDTTTGPNEAFMRVNQATRQYNVLALYGNVSDSAFSADGSYSPPPTGTWSMQNDYYVYPSCGIASGVYGPADYYSQIPANATLLHSFTMQGSGMTSLQQPVYKAVSGVTINAGDCLVHLVKGTVNGGIDAESQVFAYVQPTTGQPAPTATLTAAPASVVLGSSTVLTWSSTNATTCTGTGFSTGGATSGSLTLTPTQTTTYSIACTGNGGTGGAAATVTVTTPPTAYSVVINGGAAVTKSRSVTLALSAVPTPTQMRFSNTGVSYNAAISYAPTASWTLSNGAGTKTVYAQFRKGTSGAWSTAVTDTIVFDNVAPTISGIAASGITNASAIITWTTNEPATSQVDYGLTTNYTTATPVDTTLKTSHSVQVTGLSPSTTYNYRARSKDAAGNERIGGSYLFTTSAGQQGTTTVPTPPTVSLGANPTSVVLGGSSVLSWSSTNASSCSASSAWSGSKATSGSESVTPTATSTYALVCTGAGGTASTSVVVAVTSTTSPQTMLWNSWEVVTQAGSPQGTVTSNTGVAATVELYESTNNFGVAKGSLFSTFASAAHFDTFNKVRSYWTNNSSEPGYPYAGKSTVGRGSDTSESNTPLPLGVFDLAVHPPQSDHTVVVAFKAPLSGTYTVSNLGARRVDSAGASIRYRLFDAIGAQLALLTATNNRAWVTSGATYTTTLTAGQYLYFAVDRNGDFDSDASEVIWTVTKE